MPEPMRKTHPIAPAPGGGGGGEGPRSPQVEKPNTEELLKKMRKVDPDQARRYRQRTHRTKQVSRHTRDDCRSPASWLSLYLTHRCPQGTFCPQVAHCPSSSSGDVDRSGCRRTDRPVAGLPSRAESKSSLFLLRDRLRDRLRERLRDLLRDRSAHCSFLRTDSILH